MNQKILFISTRLPLPVNDGRSYTLNQYIMSLLSKYDVGLVSLYDDKEVSKQDARLSFVYKLNKTNFITKIFNVFKYSLIKRYPLQLSAIYSYSNYKKLKKIIISFKPDIIICDMLRTSIYLKKIKCKKILDMDDILSKRYSMVNYSSNNIFGQFSSSLPNLFNKFVNVMHLDKRILQFEHKHMEKLENKSVKSYDNVILVSPLEVKKLKEKTQSLNVSLWPVAVNVSTICKENIYDKNKICFIGNINVSHNFDTLMYLCDHILPYLSAEFKVIVIGKCSKENQQKFVKFSNVEFSGYVDSVENVAKQCLCMVAPIQFGTGIKIKILESMGMGIPVITSQIGVEGLNVENYKNIIIANNPNEYVEAINYLANNANERNLIKNNAIEYVRKNHSFENATNLILETIKEVLNK